MAIALDFDKDTFNGLPDIEEASHSLISQGLISKMLESIGSTFVEHNLSDAWGICILHKHWQLEGSEYPLQVIGLAGAKEFVSTPATHSKLEFHPLVYRVEAGSLRPMEFSTDDSTRVANEQLFANPSGMRALIESMDRLGFSEHFGLFALKPLPDDSELVEFNFADRISIVREMRQGEMARRGLIETTWRFYPTITAGKCTTKCLSLCSSDGNGGHNNTGHQVYHDPNG